MIRRRDLWPLGAAAFILAVTVSWWGLALWSVPGAPAWLARARAVCFNITESGLPDAKGWLLLIGQPPSLIALLLLGWGRDVRETLSHLASSSGGRAVLAGALLMVSGGLGLAGVRVAGARVPEVDLGAAPALAIRPVADMTWPDVEGLVDQAGLPFSVDRLKGTPALVTFAFGHCRTVCPAVVHQARAARLSLDARIPIVVLTLDPWRDTPSRLGSLVRQFELDPDLDHVVGGAIESVEAALDAWDVPRRRDARTGDVVHPSLLYLVEPDGTVAYASNGARARTVELGERLGWRSFRK